MDLRYQAYKAVHSAIRRGDLVRQDCEGCGMKNGRFVVHAHHEDYAKPLDVRWMCGTCHTYHHLALRHNFKSADSWRNNPWNVTRSK